MKILANADHVLLIGGKKGKLTEMVCILERGAKQAEFEINKKKGDGFVYGGKKKGNWNKRELESDGEKYLREESIWE